MRLPALSRTRLALRIFKRTSAKEINMNFIRCFFARRKYVKTPEFNQILSDCYDIIDQQKILIAQSQALSSKYCTANPHIEISVSLSVLKNLDKDLIKKITKLKMSLIIYYSYKNLTHFMKKSIESCKRNGEV